MAYLIASDMLPPRTLTRRGSEANLLSSPLPSLSSFDAAVD